MSTYLLCIPTYNEAENIQEIIHRTLALTIEGLHILVIDDNSPDGTAALVESLNNSNISLLKRDVKNGLGPAYIAGFTWGLERNFDYFIEMDADGSHQPEELLGLISKCDVADLVLGTRWMPGGSVQNWPLYRRMISRLGTWYAEWALRMPYKDLTGGFRVLSADALRSVNLKQISTIGYGFQIEMAMRIHDLRIHDLNPLESTRIIEVPITFIERTKGQSKMSGRIVWEALIMTTRWGIQRRLNCR